MPVLNPHVGSNPVCGKQAALVVVFFFFFFWLLGDCEGDHLLHGEKNHRGFSALCCPHLCQCGLQHCGLIPKELGGENAAPEDSSSLLALRSLSKTDR
jgi:hypothetical protein